MRIFDEKINKKEREALEYSHKRRIGRALISLQAALRIYDRRDSVARAIQDVAHKMLVCTLQEAGDILTESPAEAWATWQNDNSEALVTFFEECEHEMQSDEIRSMLCTAMEGWHGPLEIGSLALAYAKLDGRWWE